MRRLKAQKESHVRTGRAALKVIILAGIHVVLIYV